MPEHPEGISLVFCIEPLTAPDTDGLADLIGLNQCRPAKILDVLASHRICCNVYATKNRKAQFVALDWAPVLEVGGPGVSLNSRPIKPLWKVRCGAIGKLHGGIGENNVRHHLPFVQVC